MLRTGDISKISGNAIDATKRYLVDPRVSFNAIVEESLSKTFADVIVDRIVVVDVSIVQCRSEPLSLKDSEEARVVCRLIVEEDMVNGLATLHAGCSTLLIELCSALAISTLQMHLTGNAFIVLSQSLNVVFHAPAAMYVGEELRIVNTSLTVGKRVMSARAEIWSVTRKRLVASGVHIKVSPTREIGPGVKPTARSTMSRM